MFVVVVAVFSMVDCCLHVANASKQWQKKDVERTGEKLHKNSSSIIAIVDFFGANARWKILDILRKTKQKKNSFSISTCRSNVTIITMAPLQKYPITYDLFNGLCADVGVHCGLRTAKKAFKLHVYSTFLLSISKCPKKGTFVLTTNLYCVCDGNNIMWSQHIYSLCRRHGEAKVNSHFDLLHCIVQIMATSHTCMWYCRLAFQNPPRNIVCGKSSVESTREMELSKWRLNHLPVVSPIHISSPWEFRHKLNVCLCACSRVDFDVHSASLCMHRLWPPLN